MPNLKEHHPWSPAVPNWHCQVVGTGSVGIFNGSTEAYLQGDTVANAESLIVNADHNSRFAIAAGGVTIGGEALAATFAVASDSNTTKAHIDDSAVNATGAINVEAKNTSKLTTGVSAVLLAAQTGLPAMQ